MSRGRGRPLKLTEERTQILVENIDLGMPYRLACQAAGIAFQTFNEWMKQGAHEKDIGEDTIYTDFHDRIKKAEADCARGCLQRIREKVLKNNSPYYDTWMLSRRYPDDFGERQHITSDNKNQNENVNVNVDATSPEEIRSSILSGLSSQPTEK